MRPAHDPIDVGATADLSLRVSVATLVRVICSTAEDDQAMLALERKATFREAGQRVVLKAQPFGGAVRINDAPRLSEVTGGFRFDSERSRAEQDFRIVIRPTAWPALKDICIARFRAGDDALFETTPARELAEEFGDSLHIRLDPAQYVSQPLWTVLEDEPTPTDNIHAAQEPTVRVYRVFEAQIVDRMLWQAIKLNSETVSDLALRERVRDDRRSGGRGRANACMTIPVEHLRACYLPLAPGEQRGTVSFRGTTLDAHVPALLDGYSAPRFQYLHT